MNSYYYSLIQYCPNLARLEVSNIGVVLYCPSNNFKAVRLSQDERKIKSKHFDLFQTMADGLRHKLQNLKSLDELNNYTSMLVNSFRMTPFMPCSAENNPQNELNKMFDDLVEEEVKLISQFRRHEGVGKRRFLWRSLGDQFQVYGYGLDHICFCDTTEYAIMVANALEDQADSETVYKEALEDEKI